MLRPTSVAVLSLLATPALAHEGDHTHLALVDGLVHGLLDHGALAATGAVVVIGAALLARKWFRR